METITSYFQNYINSILFFVNLMEQEPSDHELKNAFINYINNIKVLINNLKIKENEIVIQRDKLKELAYLIFS